MTKYFLIALLLLQPVGSYAADGISDTNPKHLSADGVSTIDAQEALVQHAAIGMTEVEPTENKQHTKHPDAQWFGQAALGLFLHWGISSVHGGGDISWMMMANCGSNTGKATVTPNTYYALADRFHPEKYDPEKWIHAAAEAGFTYAVLTTKHHDGYAMWPSAFGEIGVRKSLPGLDLVRPFVEACRKYGLKVGLYYSPPDWYYNRGYMSFNQGKPDFDMNHHPVVLPKKPDGWDVAYRAYLRNQIEELLTLYGPIDLIWFDGQVGGPVISIERIRELQPSIVINPRLHGMGDFATPEVAMPSVRPPGWWELCCPWSVGGWGYNKREEYRSLSWMLANLAKVRAWNGNLLVNVSPRPDGTLPESCYERMKETAQWMAINRESVVGIDTADHSGQANTPVTQKGNTLYLFVVPEMSEPVDLKIEKRPSSVRLLGGKDFLPFSYKNGKAKIPLDAIRRSPFMDVIAVSR